MSELRRVEKQDNDDFSVNGYLVISEENDRVIAAFFSWDEAVRYCELYNEFDGDL